MEESLIKAKKLNGNYNPFIFRIIDSDGIPNEQITLIKAKKERKALGLNYKISVLDIHEIENLLLLDRTYQSTAFYQNYPDLAQFIRDNYEDKLKNSFTSTATQFFLSNREEKKESNFSTEVNKMEKQMLLDPIRRIN